jgi:DNA uptake protein ComE-like DNA-binding protein
LGCSQAAPTRILTNFARKRLKRRQPSNATRKRSVDLNKAPKEDLASLPGLDEHKADRIVAERPFANTHQLVTRHILTEDEYSAVQDRVVIGH